MDDSVAGQSVVVGRGSQIKPVPVDHLGDECCLHHGVGSQISALEELRWLACGTASMFYCSEHCPIQKLKGKLRRRIRQVACTVRFERSYT